MAGDVENPFTLTWDQFLALPQVDDVSDFHCVTTWSRYDNHWRGVRFKTIAELAVPKDDARFVLCTGYDSMPGSSIPYTTNVPLGARGRRRRAARAHVGRQTAAARARRAVPHDHAEAVRVEGREVDPQDRVSRAGRERLLGNPRLLEQRRALVQRPLRDTGIALEPRPCVRMWPGDPSPLGATWTGVGVNFALFSEHAERVELCLFDSVDATKESARIELREQTDMVWHGFLPDASRTSSTVIVSTDRDHPGNGHRFNPNKVVMDPYAKSVARTIRWADEMFGYRVGDPNGDLTADDRDNAAFAPLAAVVDPAFTWGDDRHPRTPWHNTVIYELHVRGFSKLHPGVPEHVRGTYEALTTEQALNHLKDLGVTAVELMPVHHHARDRHLEERGLTNYWGYNSFGYFAPERRFAASRSAAGAVREFKRMVRALHAAGLEVILDVVYNHTAEGNHLGPTLSLKGIDNASYYRLTDEDRRYYMDFTGCGNTLNMQSPHVLQLIMDSLRYWVLDMHVDGFRFDLASALARELFDVDRLARSSTSSIRTRCSRR